MSASLFDTGKVGCFLDTITHSTENRRGDEVKVVILTLRIDPFDVKLATSLDQRVRVSLFQLNHPEPHAHLRRADFALGVKRQNLNVFASPDTKKASICLTQAAITGLYARTQKDANGYVLVFKASFGPVGREELAFIEDWRNGQKFVTFQEAEPSMAFDDPDEDDDSDEAPSTRPGPMWDEADQASASGDTEGEAARVVPMRGTRKKTDKVDPDEQRRQQSADGKNRGDKTH